MIDEKKIARINELYHRSKAEGLSEEEKEEQELYFDNNDVGSRK